MFLFPSTGDGGISMLWLFSISLTYSLFITGEVEGYYTLSSPKYIHLQLAHVVINMVVVASTILLLVHLSSSLSLFLMARLIATHSHPKYMQDSVHAWADRARGWTGTRSAQ
jgi:hypothetical protein